MLKPFTKADILAQVQKSRKLTGIAAPEEVCRKNGLSNAEYLDELRALMNELRSLQQSSANRIFTHNYLAELVALERIRRVASKFGAVRILELITQMTQVTKEARELPAEPTQRSYSDMFQILQDIQREAARLEHQGKGVNPQHEVGVQGQFMRPIIVGDDVRSLIIPRLTRDQRLLTSSPTAS